MTEKELKGLSRADLLELLIEESKKVKQLEECLQQAEAKLESKEIAISNAGSIAEAALQLNGVFEAAQAAGAQYLDNIRTLSQNQEVLCAQMEQECREKTARQLAETQQQCDALHAQTKADCARMVVQAELESKAYWDEVSSKLEAFYKEHAGLKQLLAAMN